MKSPVRITPPTVYTPKHPNVPGPSAAPVSQPHGIPPAIKGAPCK
jgi:hypothetical protein